MSDDYNWAQVQVRLIDLADEITKGFDTHMAKTEDKIDKQCEWFDRAYKALAKTVAGE